MRAAATTMARRLASCDKELCRKHGFGEPSYYAWKAKFGCMNVSDAQRLKALEAENGKLKADLQRGRDSRALCAAWLDDFECPLHAAEGDVRLAFDGRARIAPYDEAPHVKRLASSLPARGYQPRPT